MALCIVTYEGAAPSFSGAPEFTSDAGATVNDDANARCIIIEHTYSEISIIRGHNFVRRGTPII